MQKKEITRYEGYAKEKITDNIVNEYRITLSVNKKEILAFSTYPLNNKELAIGFLFSERIISSINDILDYNFNEKNKEISINIKNEIIDVSSQTLTSGCAKGTTFRSLEELDPFTDRLMNFNLFLANKKIFELMKEFQTSSDIFNKTGAVHLAALATTKEILYHYEDIGRHNAIDKVLGKALIEKIDLNDKILLSTGRISSEIISKIIVSGIPIIISRAAPTSYAVDLGNKFGVTIVGFCRGKRFNVYSHQSRIK